MRSSKRVRLAPRNDDGPLSSRSEESRSKLHFISSGIVGYGSRKFGPLLQGGGTPIYPILRSSSSVKVLTYLIFVLTLDQENNFALTFG